MILVDFSTIMFQSIFASPNVAEAKLNENNKYNSKDLENTIIGLIVGTLFEIQQHNVRYGNMAICLDSTNNWRNDILKTYKSKRKTNRDESPIPFDELFPIINELKEYIDKYTPWNIVKVERAEADDCILVLANEYANNEDVLIVSSDKDMIQVQSYHDNIVQYSPMKHEFITFENKAETMSRWIVEHTILGDAIDEIPKITDNTEFSDSFKDYIKMTPKQFLSLNESVQREYIDNFDVVDKKGKKDVWKNMRLGVKTLDKIVKNGLDEFLDSNELYRENLERNKKLILMEYIPEFIKDDCLKQIKTKDVKSDEFKNYLNNRGLTILANAMPFNFNSKPLDLEDLLKGF